MWGNGKIQIWGQNFEWSVKRYEVGSVFGINGGGISKLFIKAENGEYFCSYDRGWDVKPKTQAAKLAFEMLLEKFN